MLLLNVCVCWGCPAAMSGAPPRCSTRQPGHRVPRWRCPRLRARPKLVRSPARVSKRDRRAATSPFAWRYASICRFRGSFVMGFGCSGPEAMGGSAVPGQRQRPPPARSLAAPPGPARPGLAEPRRKSFTGFGLFKKKGPCAEPGLFVFTEGWRFPQGCYDWGLPEPAAGFLLR